MNHSNQYHDPISTVQLSPFGEDQWNRIVTYSPIYLHWTDLTTMSPKRTSAKRNLVNKIDVNAIKLDDGLVLDELSQMRRAVFKPTLKQKRAYHEAKFLDEEEDERPASPTEEYQRSTDFFYQTREPSFVNQQYNNTKRSLIQPQVYARMKII